LLIDHTGAGLQRVDSTADVLNFYLEKGEITITGKDSVYKADITGSKINDDSKRLMAQLKPIVDRAKQLNEEKRSASPIQQNSADFQNQMQSELKKLQIEQGAAIKIFILSNPNSYLSLLALYSVGGPTPDPVELDSLYSSLSPDIKNTESAKIFETSLNELKHTAVGVTAPDFSQPDMNGDSVKLSSFRGKYVLLDFWASWCGPCREENPNVVKVYNRFKDKNFTILSVSLDKAGSKGSWLSAVKSDGLTWTQVSDLKFWNNSAALLYYITSIPSNFLIDPNGKIIARDLRGQDLENELEQVLGK
jgi:peroxiredoxin